PPLLTLSSRSLFFFSNPPATTEIYTLSLHDALPIFYKIADIGFQMIADFRNRRRQQVGIAGRELDLDILARRWPGIGLAGFDDNAAQMRCSLADILKDIVRRAAFLPLLELHLDCADDVFRDILPAAATGAHTRIDRLEIIEFEDLILHLADELILLMDRHIAARVNVDECNLRLHIGEKFNAISMGR